MNLTRTTTPIQAWPRSLSYLLSSVFELDSSSVHQCIKRKERHDDCGKDVTPLSWRRPSNLRLRATSSVSLAAWCLQRSEVEEVPDLNGNTSL